MTPTHLTSFISTITFGFLLLPFLGQSYAKEQSSEEKSNVECTEPRQQEGQENETCPQKWITRDRLEAWGIIGKPKREDRILPFMADIAEDRELPSPMGLNFSYYSQEADWAFVEAGVDYTRKGQTRTTPGLPSTPGRIITIPNPNPFKPDKEITVPGYSGRPGHTITLPDQTLSLVTNPDLIDLNVAASTSSFKVDAWVLPFMNVFATMGKASADVNLNFNEGWGSGNLNGVPIADLPMGELNLKFAGPVYATGIVLAGGYKRFFLSTDFTVAFTQLSFDGGGELQDVQLGDGMYTFTAAPRIGYNYGTTQVWVGARYMKKETSFHGSMTLESGNTLDYDIELDAPAIHYSVGARYTFADRWEVLGEVGFGERKAVNLLFGYRF